jgi:hypothetical protein
MLLPSCCPGVFRVSVSEVAEAAAPTRRAAFSPCLHGQAISKHRDSTDAGRRPKLWQRYLGRHRSRSAIGLLKKGVLLQPSVISEVNFATTLVCLPLKLLVPLLCKYDTPVPSSVDPHTTPLTNHRAPALSLLYLRGHHVTPGNVSCLLLIRSLYPSSASEYSIPPSNPVRCSFFRKLS